MDEQRIYIVFFAITLFFLLRSFFTLVFRLENYKLHKKRLDQLKFENEKDNDEEINKLIDKITQPIIKNAFPRLKLDSLEKVGRDLKIIGWDNKFNAKQYLALIYLGRILAVGLVLLLFPYSKFMAFLWGAVLFIAPNLFLKNAANNKRKKILIEFPDFIRVTKGYLMAGYPLTRAIRESIRYVGEDWQKILEKFVVTAEMSGIDVALENMAIDADIFEAREFISLIRLTLEQGGNAREGFEQQASKIQEMLYDAMMKKVEQRAIYGIIIQGPLLLCSLLAFGLPTFNAMMNIGG